MDAQHILVKEMNCRRKQWWGIHRLTRLEEALWAYPAGQAQPETISVHNLSVSTTQFWKNFSQEKSQWYTVYYSSKLHWSRQEHMSPFHFPSNIVNHSITMSLLLQCAYFNNCCSFTILLASF